MKIRSAKNKGRRLVIKVIELIKKYFNFTDDDIKPNPASINGMDIILSSQKSRDIFPFAIECKNTETLNIWRAIEQARNNASGHIPAVVFSKNREEIYITLPFEFFLQIWGEL